MVRISSLNDAFGGIFELEASPVVHVGHNSSKKMREGEKGKAKKFGKPKSIKT